RAQPAEPSRERTPTGKRTLAKRLIMTVHGNSPSWLSISSDAALLKNSYAEASCKAFFFTVLRDPGDMRLSAYAMWFHNAQYTAKKARSLMLDNLEAQFLFTGYRGPKRSKNMHKVIVNDTNIQEVLNSLGVFDFIGRTDQISGLLSKVAGFARIAHCSLQDVNVNAHHSYRTNTERDLSQLSRIEDMDPTLRLDYRVWTYVQNVETLQFLSIPCTL
ncbi:hypothetical protein CYMTET_17606, partial [Cymbomonas tetramitiformis]